MNVILIDQNKTDQTGSGETSNTLDEQIQRYTKKIQERQTTYDRLLEKYCLEN